MMKKIILLTLLPTTLLFTGTFVMKKGEVLKKTELTSLSTPKTNTQNDNTQITSSDTVRTKLTKINKIDTRLNNVNEVFILENKLLENIIGDEAVTINGTKGANQTVIIKNSRFTNVTQALRIVGVDNVIIEGNYFEKTWSVIKCYYAKSVIIRHNKSKNHGTLNYLSNANWSGNFAQIADQNAMDKLIIEHNLIDRSDDNRESKHPNTFAEDYINIYQVKMSSGKESSIGYNYIIGSELNNESITAGGITIDQEGEHHRIHNNVIYNAGSFCIGIASSRNINIENNVGLQTAAHDKALLSHAKHYASGSTKTGPDRVSAITLTNYRAKGKVPYPSKNITLTANKLIAVRYQRDPGFSNHWLDIDIAEIKLKENSFQANSKNGDNIINTMNITDLEMKDLIFGKNRAGLFQTHGIGLEYFKE